ncbi:MAG: class I SAM-dependent methyltransferase [Patescibacteria group bacterium]
MSYTSTTDRASRDGYNTVLDPLLSWLRRRRIAPYIHRGSSLLDIGCGNGALLLSVADMLAHGVGIDRRIAHPIVHGNIRLIGGNVDTTLPFADNSFDTAVLLAVLEHLEHPDIALREIARVLRPGGNVLITVPTKRARPVLEFLAFRIGIISREGVADHKRYYTKPLLTEVLHREKFIVTKMSFFEAGFNLFAAATKPL